MTRQTILDPPNNLFLYMKQSFSFIGILMLMFTLSASAQSVAPELMRPVGVDGLTVFETVGTPDGTFDGVKLYWGADFTQQFQALNHSNDGNDPLLEIGNGFNLATANLNMTAVLADGIAVNLVTYLSSQHHREAWVKGGYLQVDSVPIEALKPLFEVVSMRVGHMELNYGDAHFRRTDNGAAFNNPFVGNLIMDSFATEIGAEVYATFGNMMVMAGMTGGEIKGRVDRPDDRAPTFLTKLVVDKTFGSLRGRLAGSMYTTSKSVGNTLFSGDRAGSRFYDVLVEGSGDSFRNGRYSPGYRSGVTAFQVNPFVQVGAFQVHGILEFASGNSISRDTGEPVDGDKATQRAVDVLYTFGDFYVGGRYNTVDHGDVSITRTQAALGWFLTDNVLTKVNYVNQDYDGAFDNGSFNGFTVEGVISF